MALSRLRKVLIILLCIAQLFLIIMIATYFLWAFTWSPWSHSEKCPNLCQGVLNNAKTLERTWSGDRTDLDGVDDDDQFPDESWANISKELYSFLVPQPPGFPEAKKDVPTTRKETTSTTQTTTTTERPYRYPPIASITYGIVQGFGDMKRTTGFRVIHEYICTGVVLGTTYVVVTKSCVYEYRDQYDNIWANINSNYTANEGAEGVNLYNYPQVEYFKDLAKLRFQRQIGNASYQFAQPLKHNVELKTAHAFVWTAGKKEIPVRKIEVNVKGTTQLSTPLFMIEDDTYYLFGFAVNGRIIPNIYSTEYGNWLEKP